MNRHYHVLVRANDELRMDELCTGGVVTDGFGAGSPDYVAKSIQLGDEFGEDNVAIQACIKDH